MRILHLTRTVSPHSGGVTEALLQLAKAHEQAGHPADVASLDAPTAPFLSHCPLPLHALGNERQHNYGTSLTYLNWLKKNHRNYDAVVSHGLWQYHGVAARKALAGSPTPYYVFPHGMLDPYFHKAYPVKFLKKWIYWKFVEHLNLSAARAVLFTCEQERKLARTAFSPYRVAERVTGLGTSAPTVDLSTAAARFIHKHPVLQSKPFLLFLGRLHNKKGLDLLIRAFAQAQKDQIAHTHKLAIVGPCVSPGYYQALQNLASSCEDIHFLDMLNGDEKWGAYAAADAMILPSHQENFGLVVPESLACSTPVLISNKVNIWREVQDAKGGLVAEDTIVGTRHLIEQWCTYSAKQKTAMRINAYQTFTTKFAIQRSAECLIAALAR